MPRDLEVLRCPPEGVLGTLSAASEMNYRVNPMTGEPVRDERGQPVVLAEKQRGNCALMWVLNVTDPRECPMRPREEAELRYACRTALDRHAAGARIPFTTRQRKDLLHRYYLNAPKAASQIAEALAGVERYLVAAIGGDEVAAQFRSIWEADRPKDAKAEERRRKEDELLAKLPNDDATDMAGEPIEAPELKPVIAAVAQEIGA